MVVDIGDMESSSRDESNVESRFISGLFELLAGAGAGVFPASGVGGTTVGVAGAGRVRRAIVGEADNESDESA